MIEHRAPVVSLILVNSDEGDDGPLDFAADRLNSFSFIDRDTKVDRCEIVFRNADKKLLDDPRLKSGQEYLVQWGYPHVMSQIYSMIVKSGKEAGLNFQVEMKGKAVALDKAKNYQQWRGLRDSDVAAEIFAYHGYDGVKLDLRDTPVTRATITQSTSDARFLTKLAHRNGFRWWIDASGAHFRPWRKDVNPYKWYTYRGYFPGDGEILEPGPSIEVNFARDVQRVRVRGVDPYTLAEVVAEYGVAGGDAEIDYETSLGEQQEIGNPDDIEGNRQGNIARTEEVNIGLSTQSDANAQAEALYREIANKRYKMSMAVLGDPLLGARTLIGLRNYTTTYSGLYYVNEIIHQITPGKYRCELKTTRDAVGKLYLEKVVGIFGDRNSASDPGGQGAPKADELERIAVKRRGPNNKQEWQWAHRSKNNPGGKTFKYEEMDPALRARLESQGQ